MMREDWERGVKPQFMPSLNRDYPIRVPAGAFPDGNTTDSKCDPNIKKCSHDVYKVSVPIDKLLSC